VSLRTVVGAVGVVALVVLIGTLARHEPATKRGQGPGTVTERAEHGTGVTLTVRHDDGATRQHAYVGPQSHCVALARWPDCVG
jgi:hypothetical protein